MQLVHVLLIDSHRLFREGLKRIFSDVEFRVIGEAGTMEEALAMPPFAEDGPSMILADSFPCPADAASEVAEIRHRYPAARFVILASQMRPDLMRAAVTLGADGFLLKEISSDAFILSLRLIVAGGKVFPSDVAHVLRDDHAAVPEKNGVPLDLQCLSDREREVLQCLVEGNSNKSIARILSIAEGTVKVHLKSVLKKLSLRNRTAAAIWAIHRGLAPPVRKRTVPMPSPVPLPMAESGTAANGYGARPQ